MVNVETMQKLKIMALAVGVVSTTLSLILTILTLKSLAEQKK